MTDTPTGTPATPLSRALDTVRILRAQLREQSGAGPVAIVGAGVRFAGGIADLNSYWAALADGRDLVRPLSATRQGPFAGQWASLPHNGGFLDEVMDFDADFFNLNADEARGMDPQQRLLIEVAWEAMEDAGLPPDRIDGTRVGLFVGVTGQDYWDWHSGDVDANWAGGNGHCFAVGRLAYVLGLSGPAITVDTACSSSLVSVHLARQALARRECDVALAGGVNLVLSPRATRLHQLAGTLSPDGRCRAFDARADGFGRGEGCGVVVLKRLADAVRDGDRIHGVIHGSAVNQSGRSTGFGAPNVLSQASLLRAALADADLGAADIGLIEAHGTGTSLGDTVEMEAVASVLGRQNGGRPLAVGSVKTNMGHLEPAAGVASLLKAVLCLRNQTVPPLVTFTSLNPLIDLDGTEILLPTASQPWPDRAGRYAGVSGFGMGGTNAHVVVGAADQPDMSTSESDEPPWGFEVCAKTEQSIRVVAARYRDQLEQLRDEDYAAFAYTATFGRARHPWRARVTTPDRATAVAALTDLAAGQSTDAVRLFRHDDWRDGDGAPPPLTRAVIDLPHYPWVRQRFAPPVAENRPVAGAPPLPGASAGPDASQAAPRPSAPVAQSTPAAAAPVADTADEGLPRRPFDPTVDKNHRILALRPGILASLTPTVCDRTVPGSGQVEIEVAAAGLNFADVLKAMDACPGFDGVVPLGGECAGTVIAVGDGVRDIGVGDAVIAVAPSAMAAYTTTAAHMVAPRPVGLTDEQAAAVPIAFLTAVYGLRHLARLQPGETVLLHSATGGVGLAGLMVARDCGAEVIATAGTHDKRALLRDLGVAQVLDSRSLTFADAVRRGTDGRGVDVVLNSLIGEALVRSVELLAPGGRFVEIGKRDVYDDTPLSLGLLKHNRSFFAVDMEELWGRPGLVTNLLRQVRDGFDRGVYRALPVTSYPYSDARLAFAHMAQALHTGKLVLRRDGTEQVAVANGSGTVDQDSGELHQKLLAVEPGRRRRMLLVQHCRGTAARVLGTDPNEIDPAMPLSSLGFSSMQILELRARLEASLHIRLPATVGYQFPTLEALAPFLAERMGIQLEAGAPDAPTPHAKEFTVDDLSEAEIEALLLARIEQLDEGRR